MKKGKTYLEDEYRQIFRNLTYPERVRGFQPEVFVRTAKKIGARVVAVDVRTQCFSLHNTRVYVKDPILGKRDLVKETVSACQKYGLKFIGYVAPLSFESWFRKRDDWQQRWPDGSVASSWKTWGAWKTLACWNTGFGGFLADELAEITKKYRPDGFYIDGLLIERHACYCPACQNKFQAEFGRSLPEKPDWDSKEWYKYLDWRYRPAFYLNRVGTEVQNDITAGASIEDSQRLWSVMTHAVYRVLATRMLGSGRKSHSFTYFPPQVPEAAAAVEINSVLASGGIPCIQGCASYLTDIMKRIEEVELYLKESEEVRSVGLIFSDLTRDACYRENDKLFFTQIHGIFRFLMESHTPFQLAGDHQIDENDLAEYEIPGYRKQALHVPCKAIHVNADRFCSGKRQTDASPDGG